MLQLKIPRQKNLVVDRAKVVEYLLNGSHPDNGGKASFFLSHGFCREQWHLFAAALRQQAVSGNFVTRVDTAHGTKFIVDGRMGTPGGKTRVIRTVWILDPGEDFLRLVTAYPGEE